MIINIKKLLLSCVDFNLQWRNIILTHFVIIFLGISHFVFYVIFSFIGCCYYCICVVITLYSTFFISWDCLYD